MIHVQTEDLNGVWVSIAAGLDLPWVKEQVDTLHAIGYCARAFEHGTVVYARYADEDHERESVGFGDA